MKTRSKTALLLGLIPLATTLAASAADAVDVNAAMTLAKSKRCERCHDAKKKKEGPSYKLIAKFYRRNPDAEAVLIEHVTTESTVKLSDGRKEEHPTVLDQSPEEIRNLVRWVLSH